MGEYIGEILLQWKNEAFVESLIKTENIRFQYDSLKNKLTIFTGYPGWLIGCKGKFIVKYTDILRKEINQDLRIELVEVDRYNV